MFSSIGYFPEDKRGFKKGTWQTEKKKNFTKNLCSQIN